MPPFFQLFHDPGRECLFHLDLLSTDPLPSRRVERILRIHQEVHCIHDDLDTNLIAKGLFSCLASYKASHPVKERRSIQLFGNRKEAVQ